MCALIILLGNATTVIIIWWHIIIMKENTKYNSRIRMHFKIICGSPSVTRWITYYFDEQGLSKTIPRVHSRVHGQVLSLKHASKYPQVYPWNFYCTKWGKCILCCYMCSPCSLKLFNTNMYYYLGVI